MLVVGFDLPLPTAVAGTPSDQCSANHTFRDERCVHIADCGPLLPGIDIPACGPQCHMCTQGTHTATVRKVVAPRRHQEKHRPVAHHESIQAWLKSRGSRGTGSDIKQGTMNANCCWRSASDWQIQRPFGWQQIEIKGRRVGMLDARQVYAAMGTLLRPTHPNLCLWVSDITSVVDWSWNIV
jgi:hypothetical protein